MTALYNKGKKFKLLMQRLGLGGFSSLPALLLMAVLILYPLGCLLLQAVFPHLYDMEMSWQPSLTSIIDVLSDNANTKAILNSAVTGVCAAFVATLLGTLTAYSVYRSGGKVKAALQAAVWLLFFSPSYLIAQGWIIFMQDGGIASQLFGLAPGWSDWFFSRFGLILVMGFRYFPFVHLAMSQAFSQLGEEYIRAARMLGANKRVLFTRIIFPLLTPAWMAGASIAFAEGFGDFGMAAAITPHSHVPTITYRIYTALNQAPVNYSEASVLSAIVLLVTSLALWMQFRWMKKGSYTLISTHTRPIESKGSTRGAAWTSMVLLVFALLLPFGSTLTVSLWKSWSGGIAASNWTLSHYTTILDPNNGAMLAISRSLLYALIVAVTTLVLGIIISFQMTFYQNKINKALDMIIMSTMAIPGVVLAAGFVFAWNATWLIPLHLVLYGTPACLALAYMASALPYSVRLQLGAMSQLSGNLLTAAQVLGAGKTRVLRAIVLPLIKMTVGSCFALTFIHTFFELPASSMLYPAGKPPLPIAISARFNSFDWPAGSAMAVEGMLVLILLYGLAYRWLRKPVHRPSSAQEQDKMQPETAASRNTERIQQSILP
ncbi:ABC transporter permease [Brevibacillus reuszeri]|uniref:ABC transporter permease n=1 Tax=Brevibacillus reuszeri TaxID=54915 RepID=UPI003D1F326C